MGSSPTESEIRVPAPVFPVAGRTYVPPVPVPYRRPDPAWRYWLLFVLTLLSTTMVGASHFQSFYLGFTEAEGCGGT